MFVDTCSYILACFHRIELEEEGGSNSSNFHHGREVKENEGEDREKNERIVRTEGGRRENGNEEKLKRESEKHGSNSSALGSILRWKLFIGEREQRERESERIEKWKDLLEGEQDVIEAQKLIKLQSL